MSYLPIHPMDFPEWALIVIGVALAVVVLMFPLDAWYHRKKKVDHVSNKRLLLTIVLLVAGFSTIIGSVLNVFNTFERLEVENKHNFTNNLHQKYDFKDILRIDSEDYADDNKHSYVNATRPQIIEIKTIDDKVAVFRVEHNQETFEPTLHDIGGEVKVSDLTKD